MTNGTGVGLKNEVEYFIFEKNIKNEVMETSSTNLPSAIQSCINYSNTFIGVKDRYSREFSIEDDKTLFLQFCDLNIRDQFSHKEFLDKYGFLTNLNYFNSASINNCRELIYSIEKQIKDNIYVSDVSSLYAEPLTLWLLIQTRLRTLVRMWRFIKSSQKEIENSYYYLLFDWIDKKLFFNDEANNRYENYLKEAKVFIDFKNIINELKFSLSPKIDISEKVPDIIAAGGIGSLVNSPKPNKLLWYADNYIEKEINDFFKDEGFKPDFIFKSGLYKTGLLISGKSQFNTQYSSLLQSMIYQFVHALTNNLEFTRCLECQKWMEKIEQGKKGKLYCGNKCRTRAYRRRRELKIIFAYESPDKFITKNLKEWGETLPKGDPDMSAFLDNLEKISSSEEVKVVFFSMLDNILANILSWTTKKSIAEHLGIDVKFLDGIEPVYNYYQEFDQTATTMTYIDWDPNHKW